MRSIFCILALLPIILFSQNNLSGLVVEAGTKLPVPYATVYINGTSIGTTTDTSGSFSIQLNTLPCVLVISHISYEPIVLPVENTNKVQKEFELIPKIVKIDEVTVKSKNQRAKNINEFKSWFLGFDNWGKNAVLLNDEALVFDRDIVRKGIKIDSSFNNEKRGFFIDRNSVHGNFEWAEDSSEIFINKPINLKATSTEPLKVDLPLLGYTVQTELVDFVVQYASENRGFQTFFLGYYYFIPYQTDRGKDLKKYDKNRKKVFYNSSQHFCRSLYNKQLKENGYQLFEEIMDSTNKKTYKEFPIEKYMFYTPDNMLEIRGLNNKHLYLFYYADSKGEPKNLTSQKPGTPIQSQIYFFSDICAIKASGIIPNNKIIFSGAISEKKVGAMLPENFQVEK